MTFAVKRNIIYLDVSALEFKTKNFLKMYGELLIKNNAKINVINNDQPVKCGVPDLAIIPRT